MPCPKHPCPSDKYTWMEANRQTQIRLAKDKRELRQIKKEAYDEWGK